MTWEGALARFEACLRNSEKPFLCGDAPGRLDAEVTFWRLGLPMLRWACGWDVVERSPLVSAWVERMEQVGQDYFRIPPAVVLMPM